MARTSAPMMPCYGKRFLQASARTVAVTAAPSLDVHADQAGQTLLTKCLDKARYWVCIAENSADVLAGLDGQSFSRILLDWL